MRPGGKRAKAEPESNSESEDSSSSSAEEVVLDLDEDGRVRVEGLTVKPFRSFPKAIAEADLPALIKDAEEVFTARATKSGSKYSAGNTFWLAADAKPQCGLEMLAREIFNLHSAGAKFDPAKSGAEWWTQVLKPTDSIGLHWDKDYPLEDQGLNLCPQIATVTYGFCYFSPLGGPTLVLEKPIPPLSGDPIVGKISRAYLSRPTAGKHMSFDGYFLHGAPAELSVFFVAPSGSSPFKQRVTFLVNVWLNHKPTNSVQLSAALRKRLSSNAQMRIPTEASPFSAFRSIGDSKRFAWTFAASEDTPIPCPLVEGSSHEALLLKFPDQALAELALVEEKKKDKTKKKQRK